MSLHPIAVSPLRRRRTGPPVATLLTPDERLRVDAAGHGLYATLHRETLDGTVQVEEEAAFEMAVRAAREEGIFVGPSSGASLAAVRKTLPTLKPGSRVLTFCYDTGERYLSVEGLFALPEGAMTAAPR